MDRDQQLSSTHDALVHSLSHAVIAAVVFIALSLLVSISTIRVATPAATLRAARKQMDGMPFELIALPET
ncbi:hypothetical protein [Rhodococcus sp. 27YEA15]|uniref:hypothetical protein n=1 Tax=Rhodococcus sp. 27YEA15 TaxID=3156259 RepID=UPI003C7BA44C